MQPFASERDTINRRSLPKASALPGFYNRGKWSRTAELPEALVDVCGKANFDPQGIMVGFQLDHVEDSDFRGHEAIDAIDI